MKGPWSNSQFTLGYSANEPVPVGESIYGEIYWIVGMKAEVLNGDGIEVLSD